MDYINHYFIKELYLKNFRNHKDLLIDFNKSSFVLYGENGLGKTNILEAISLLSFGKGLKGENLENLVNFQETSSSITSLIESSIGTFSLDVLIDKQPEGNYKKKYFLDKNPLKTNQLESYLNCIWLIPQMDNFFLQDNSLKRRFIDKLISNLDKSHITRISSYEKVLRERNKALFYNQNSIWLDKIEESLTELAVSIVAARIDFLTKINVLLEKNEKYPIKLSFDGIIENLFQEHKFALKVEDSIKEMLKNIREEDKLKGSTSIGCHKSKLSAFNTRNQLPSNRCSTGEQKMMLIEIILAFGELIKINKAIQPILLLDEINVHLDEENTKIIINKMIALQAQVFITTVNPTFYKNFTEFSFLDLKSVK